MQAPSNVNKKRSALTKIALVAGCLLSLNTLAAHNDVYTNTYNMGTLSIVPYKNIPTVTGIFSDRYDFNIAASSYSAGTAVTLNLDLGDASYHISGLDLDLFKADGTWLNGDIVTGPDDVSVTVTETLLGGNYFFRVQGTADGTLTNQGIYSFTAAAVPVPEVDTYAMLLAGLGLVGYTVVRRRHR